MTDGGRELQPHDFGIGRLFWRIREAVVVGDADTGRIVLWNPAAEALFGYSAAEATGRSIELLIPEHFRERHRAGLARFRATGRGDVLDSERGVELPALHKSGRPLTIELRLSAIDEAPVAGHFVLAVIRDATERKREEDRRVELARSEAARAEADLARHRLEVLAEASRVAGSSLEWEATLANVARLVVPQFADWCVVDILDDDGRVQPVEVASGDPSVEPLLLDLVARNRRGPGWGHHPAAVALRTGEAQLLAEVPDANLAAIARDEEHLALILRHRPRSTISVPLRSRGRTLGVISFLATEGRPRYAAGDLPFAEEVGRRAATALEHALLFKQAREAIGAREESVRLVKTLTDNATLALFMLDDRQRCTFMNPSAEAMTGFTFDEVRALDRPLHDVIHHTRPDGRPYPLSECPIDRALPRNNRERGEDIFIHKDGTLYPVAFTASPIIRDGRPVGTVVEVRDITAERRAETERANLLARERAAREQAESAVRSRDEFLSVAAHELKTPITSLLGHVQVLARRLESSGNVDPARLRRGLQIVTNQAWKLSRLVEQLLDVSRLDSGKLRIERQLVDLGRLIRPIAEAARARTDRHVVAVRGEPEVTALVDPLRIEQVLVNLLDNAIKYSPEGGPIDVEYGRVEPGGVRIAVADRGLGIPPRHREQVFERFFQAHSDEHVSGMGLGLYVSREIVRQHGGRLKAEEREGGGIRFVITLPSGPMSDDVASEQAP